MKQQQISEQRLQRIYEGSRCSALETRFLIERLRITERAFSLLAEEPTVVHSAEQFATHLLRGQGLVQMDHLSPIPATSIWLELQDTVRDLLSALSVLLRGRRVSSAS